MTRTQLKMIACISMLIDHTGAILFPQYGVLRIIGRLAFPIFAWTIATGYHYTKDVNKYLIRLGTFALASELIFDLSFYNHLLYLDYQNIFFTLFLGLLAIKSYDKCKNKIYASFIVIIIGVIATFLKTDYGMFGVLIIWIFYRYEYNFNKCAITIILITMIQCIVSNNYIQEFSLLSLFLIYGYNKQKGLRLKYLFYTFYPLHLLILKIIKFE